MTTPLAYRPQAAADAVGVSRSTIDRWMQSGLPSVKMRGARLILADDLRAFVARGGTAETSSPQLGG